MRSGLHLKNILKVNKKLLKYSVTREFLDSFMVKFPEGG